MHSSGTDFLLPGRQTDKLDEMAFAFSCVKEVGVNDSMPLKYIKFIIYEHILVILDFKYN